MLRSLAEEFKAHKVKAREGAKQPFRLHQRITRPYSIFFSFLFVKCGISANMVTLLSLLFAIIGSLLYLFNTPTFDILALVCFNLWYVMDCCDGEVARIKEETSKFGVFLDQIMHVTSAPLMALSITYHFYVIEDEIIFFVMGFLYISAVYIIQNLHMIIYYIWAGNNRINKTNKKIKVQKSFSSNSTSTNMKRMLRSFSGFYSRNIHRIPMLIIFLIILYPIDLFFSYNIMNIGISSFTVISFFILEILYTIQRMIREILRLYKAAN